MNCPFHELAEQAREETCAMNHAFLRRLASALAPDRDVVVEPRPGFCCVRLRMEAPQGEQTSPLGQEVVGQDEVAQGSRRSAG